MLAPLFQVYKVLILPPCSGGLLNIEGPRSLLCSVQIQKYSSVTSGATIYVIRDLLVSLKTPLAHPYKFSRTWQCWELPEATGTRSRVFQRREVHQPNRTVARGQQAGWAWRIQGAQAGEGDDGNTARKESTKSQTDPPDDASWPVFVPCPTFPILLTFTERDRLRISCFVRSVRILGAASNVVRLEVNRLKEFNQSIKLVVS